MERLRNCDLPCLGRRRGAVNLARALPAAGARGRQRAQADAPLPLPPRLASPRLSG